jgi:hypothetical protein
LYGRKPRSFLPVSKPALKSQHPEDDKHQQENQNKQAKQAETYNKKAGYDKTPLSHKEAVYVYNTKTCTWEPGTIFSRPNPVREPRTYMVDIKGTLYQRTRQHLRPRSNNSYEVPKDNTDSKQPVTEYHPIFPAGNPPKKDIPVIPATQDPQFERTALSQEPPAIGTQNKIEGKSVSGSENDNLNPERLKTTRSGRVIKPPKRPNV